MKLGHKLPMGQTVVFETYNGKYKVGQIIEVRPTVKRIEYTVYGEDGKVYDAMPNRVDGSYRIDVKLTKAFCDKHNIKATEYAAEYARALRKTLIVSEPEADISVFDSQLGYKKEPTNSEIED